MICSFFVPHPRLMENEIESHIIKPETVTIISGNMFFVKKQHDIADTKMVDHSLKASFLKNNYSPWTRDGDYVLIPGYHEDWTKLEQLGIYLLLNFFKLIAIERGEVLIYQCTLRDTYDNG